MAFNFVFNLVLILILGLPVFGLTRDTCDATGCPGDDKELVRNFRQGCPPNFNDVQCALKKEEEIGLWLLRNNNFNILITGKMGTGKTTLIKGLTGESYDPETAPDLLPHTVKVTSYKHEQDKINFATFDTPGLKDNPEGSNDHSYIIDMLRNIQEPDLLIFAIKMDDANFRGDDLIAINNVSSAFGWKVWKNALVILTFANKVKLEGYEDDSRENKDHYGRSILDFKMKITKILRKQNVQPKVANNIPVIPVGLIKQPQIPSAEQKVSWLNEFWETVYACLKASRHEAAEDGPTCPPCTSPTPLCTSPTCPPCTSPTCPPCTCEDSSTSEDSSWWWWPW